MYQVSKIWWKETVWCDPYRCFVICTEPNANSDDW